MKKVKWKWDMGCYTAFCPHCGEPAYRYNRCEFCNRKYKWVTTPSIQKVEVGEVEVVQGHSKHIYVFKKGIPLIHLSCTKKQNKRKLKKLANYYRITSSDEWLNEAKVLPYEFKGKSKIGEIEPHIEVVKEGATDERN